MLSDPAVLLLWRFSIFGVAYPDLAEAGHGKNGAGVCS
jgi:hypothetical protein